MDVVSLFLAIYTNGDDLKFNNVIAQSSFTRHGEWNFDRNGNLTKKYIYRFIGCMRKSSVGWEFFFITMWECGMINLLVINF